MQNFSQIFSIDAGKRLEIKLAGVGGQGVILAGTILGRAAVIYERFSAVMTKEYGSDIRGGNVCTDLVVFGGKIHYPSSLSPDVLVLLAQKAFDSNRKWLEESCGSKGNENSKRKRLLICDTDLVSMEGISLPSCWKVSGLPFNTLADSEFGSNGIANMIFLGFFAALTRIVSVKSLELALQDLLPAQNMDANFRAVEFGVRHGSVPAPESTSG